MVRNPIKRDVVYNIDLRPENVDTILFMTKDPTPMVKHIDELSEMGMNFSFQVTITPYGKDIEPGVQRKKKIIDSFKNISEIVGKDRMIWRYDPIILNDDIDIEYHREGFSYLLNELHGYTERCVISFIDIYDKFRELGSSLRNVGTNEMISIGGMLSFISKDSGIGISQCSAGTDLSLQGISNTACISREYMREMNIPYEEFTTPLRDGCTCVKNIDIGEYDTCGHDCIYCYANKTSKTSRSRKTYDSNGEMLFGNVGTDDKVIKLSSRPARRITDY